MDSSFSCFPTNTGSQDPGQQRRVRRGFGNPIGLFVIATLVMLNRAGDEVRYSMWGKNATGTVARLATQQRHNKSCSWTELKVGYEYADSDGVERNGTDEADMTSWNTVPNFGDAVDVQYVEGGGPSRLARRADSSAIAVFCILIALGVYWYYVLAD